MKTLKSLIGLAAMVIAIALTSCSENNSVDEVLAEKSVELQAGMLDSCTYDGVLTEADIAGIKWMREEEKLANNVYTFFYNKYSEQIFGNIAKSEEAHTQAILRLLEGYAIEDPALDGLGKFSNANLLALYGSLIAEGEKGVVEALKVGATIEDMDINDLKGLLAETENADIQRVYGNLLKGSENHLRAFINVLERLGESYTPQYISAEEFEAILSAETERKGNGNGNGARNGNRGAGNGGSNENCDGTQTGQQTGNGAQNQGQGNTGNGRKNGR